MLRPTFSIVCSKNAEFPPGLNCLSYEPTIPSKFMVGTEQGGVICTRSTALSAVMRYATTLITLTNRMQAKSGTNDWVLGEFENCHHGKV